MPLPLQLYDADLNLFTGYVNFGSALCNADKNVSSLDQFLSHMNKEVIVDSFPGIGSVIVTDVVRAVPYQYSTDIIHRDTKPANVLVSNFH